MERLIEAQVTRLVIDQTSESQRVYVQEKDGRRRSFQIIIGIIEALAMHRALNDERPERPMTHELILRILNGLNARVVKVVISDLRSNTFYALLSIEAGGKVLEIDARPSDALTLALHYDAPLYVAEKVFREAAE